MVAIVGQLVALHGEAVVQCYALGLSSGRETQGHRFEALRPAIALRNADSYAGSEVDILVNWAACKNFEFQVGYSHFFAGQYLAETGAADDADFGYVQTKISF